MGGCDQLLETLAVLRHVDHVRCRADDGHAVCLEVPRKFQGSLPAELDDHAVRFFLVDDFQDVFERQGFEI